MASSTDVPTIDWAASARMLFDQSCTAMLVFQPHDLRFVEFNSRAEALCGLSRSELASANVTDLLASSDRELLTDLIEACRRGQPFEAADSIRFVRGQLPSLAVRVQVGQLPAEPEPLGLLIVQQREESAVNDGAESLSPSDSRFKRILDDIDAIAWEADLPFNGMTYVSNQLETILGYSVDSWLQDPDAWANSVLPDDRQRVVQYCQSRTAEVENHDMEYRAKASDGRVLWIQDRVRVVTNNLGQPVKLRGVMIDITERKRATELLAQRESQYRLLVDNAPVCIHSIDCQRRLSSINPTGLAMLGLQDAAEVLGLEYMSFIDPADQAVIERQMEESFQGIASDTRFTCVVNGENRKFKSNFIPIVDANNVVCSVIGTTEDITTREQSDANLRKSEQQFRQLAENINAVFWMQPSDGKQPFVSPKYEDVWGRRLDAAGNTLQEMSEAIVLEDRELRAAAIDRLRAVGTDFDLEYRIDRPDGQQRWIRDRGFVIHDAEGNPTGFAGLAEDITNFTATVEKLRIQDRAIAVAKTGIVIADARRENLPVIYCNEEFERMTGYSQEEAIGRHCSFLQAHDTDQPGARALREAVAAGRDCSVVMRNYRKDGTNFWNEVSVSPVHDATGNVTHFVEFWNDISERIAIESKLRESEHRFRTLTMHVPLGIFLTDGDGRCTFVNEMCASIIGQSREACLGFGWTEFLHPSDKQRVIGAWKQSRNQGVDFDEETRFLHRDETTIWVHAKCSARLGDNGDLVGYVGSLIDITERKRTYVALAQSEERFRTIVENAPEAIVVLDVDEGQFVDWNQKALELYKTDAQQIKSKGPWDFCPPRQPDGRPSCDVVNEFIARTLAGEHPVFDFVHRDSQGNNLACEIRLARLPVGDRNVVRGSITDVTERRSAEEQLRRTRLAVESTSDAVFVIDQHGRFIDVNQTSCDRLGYSREELLSMSLPDVNKNFGFADWDHHWQKLRDAGKLVFESEQWTKAGVVIPIEISESFACVNGMEFSFAFVRDITARKQAQAELQSTQFAVDQNVCAIVRINVDGGLTYVNDAACRSLQYSRDELLNKSIWDIDSSWPKDEWANAWSNIQQAGSLTAETMHFCRDGSRVDCQATACHVRFDDEEFVFAYYVNIRERKEAQQRLRQREAQLAKVSRYSTLGEMVAGIAHEVNQPLYSILNYSKATKNILANPSAEKVQQVLRWNEQIKDAASRAGSIIKRLRGFVSQEPPNVGPAEIESVVNDATEIVSYELRRAGVSLTNDFQASSAIVRVDTVQIQQVVVNLLINAVEAIERAEATTRHITVGTRADAEFVEVFVADSGPGFPVLPGRNLFDAFVSTKPGGMGMGLAISKTIIESFGGKLLVTANEHGGATLTFRLSPYGERRNV